MNFLEMSAAEFRSYIKNEGNRFNIAQKVTGTNKFNAKKTKVDGIEYDSKWEAQKGTELRRKEEMGLIKDLKRQVVFELQEGFINNQGKKMRPITYIADFMYFDCEMGKTVVMDTKSKATRTDAYMIKRKLFEYKYPEYIFIECYKK